MADKAMMNHILKFRKARGLTQLQLANKAKVTRQTIIALEKENYTPSVKLALNLATILTTTVEELFYETKK